MVKPGSGPDRLHAAISTETRYAATTAMPLQPPLNEAPRYPVTSLIALGAIGVSLYWWTNHPIDALVPRGESVAREPWTLLSSILPHVGILHLVFNLSWWWYLGARLERAVGAVRTIGVVALLAIISSGAEFALVSSGVGLSGVVYGLCLFIWVAQRKIPALEGTVGPKALQVLGIWFVVCIVLTVTKIMPVGNVAHGAGAIAGWMLGKAVTAERGRAGWWIGLAALVALALWGATVGRPTVNMSQWR
jgi:membrane associated rhomboid family serine protease